MQMLLLKYYLPYAVKAAGDCCFPSAVLPTLCRIISPILCFLPCVFPPLCCVFSSMLAGCFVFPLLFHPQVLCCLPYAVFSTCTGQQSQYIPEVVVGRRRAVGVLGGGKGGVGQLGEGVQAGSVYRQPGTEVDKSRHIWREPSKWKGTQRGARRGVRGARGTVGDAPCIYVTQCVCQGD
jgi:hypothetical protein